MNATVLFIIADVIALFKTQGYVDSNGNFIAAKFNDIASDLAFATAIEGVLKNHGVTVPAKVDAIIAIIPAMAALFA